MENIKEALGQGGLDRELTTLYGEEKLEHARARTLGVLEGFEKTFGHAAQGLFSAPGRTELGGNHTDHQRGHVLAASVDLDLLAAVAVTGDGTARVLSEGYPMIEVDLSMLTPQPGEANTSAALIRGVCARMTELGCDFGGHGLEVYMTSNVPGAVWHYF